MHFLKKNGAKQKNMITECSKLFTPHEFAEMLSDGSFGLEWGGCIGPYPASVKCSLTEGLVPAPLW